MLEGFFFFISFEDEINFVSGQSEPSGTLLQWEVGNAGSLKVIPESRISAIEFSLLFPLSMLLRTVPDLPVDSFTKQCTVPVAAREVGFCRDSPGVGSRGRSTWKFQNYSCSLVPLMRASSVHSLDLTGRSYWLQQLSQESKHFAALTYLWYIQET